MKFNFKLIVLLICLNQLSFAQHIEFEWAINNGGLNYEEGYATTVDASGNVYSTGFFNGDVDFDPGSDTLYLTSNGDDDIFVQKLNNNGDLIWTKQFGGTTDDRAYSLKTDSQGNIYILGFFTGIIDFDPGIGTSYEQSLGQTDVFLVKLDSNGSLLWYKNFGGTNPDNGKSLELDLFGNIYITGGFNGTVDFDPGVGVFNLTSVGGEDIFILKLNSHGDFTWAKNIGGSITCYSLIEKGIVSDSLGNVYFTGFFVGTIDTDPGPAVNNISWTSGGDDVFLEKLDSNGNFVWVKQMGGFSSNRTSSIVIDQNNNIYLSGYYTGTVDFDPSINIDNLSSAGTSSYIQKFDSDGNYIWIKEIKNSSVLGFQHTIIRSLAIDNNNNLYSTGYFEGIVDFNPDQQVYNLNTGNAYGDVFIQKLNSDGQFIWAIQYGAENHEISNSIIVDEEKKIYSIGNIRENIDSIDLDPTLGVSNLISNGLTDVFIQKLSQCIPTSINPVFENLNEITALCQIEDLDIQPPLALDNCGNEIIGVSNHTFPITDQSISQISWIFEDGYGNSFMQNQNIIWDSIDHSIYFNGTDIIANNTNASYQWIECTSEYFPIIGDTNQFYTPLIYGNYALEVTENGCKDTSECLLIDNISINDYINAEHFEFYPNPTSGNLNIKYKTNTDLQKIGIYSTNGENVYQTKKIPNIDRLNIDLNLSDGLYFLKFTSHDEVYVKKLVIRN